MFKVPEWEDTPSNNVNFTNVPSSKKKNKQKSKKAKAPERQKHVIQAKPKFKAKTMSNSKLRLDNGLEKPYKTENRRKSKINNTRKQENFKLKLQESDNKNLVVNGKDSNNEVKINNYDGDNLNELIQDVLKQRLDTYKNDDNEEILFHESAEKVAPNKNNIRSNKTINSMNAHSIVESKQETLPSSPKGVNKKQNTLKDKISKTKNEDTDNAIHRKEIGKILKVTSSFKKNHLKAILQQESARNRVNVSGNKLRERMLDRLKAAQFRYLNEKLYTSSGSDAQKLFQGDPRAFQTYHEGYQQQVKKWPVKPLDIIVKRIQKMPKTHKIADMGCGEADLSKRVVQAVRSFDLVATAPGVEACDMAHTPLLAQSMDVVVYCLALMGTDLTQYLLEANRVLKLGGHLLIAEVESRFDNVQTFTSDVQRLGFSLKKMDDSNKVFYFLEFTKLRDPPVKKGKLPTLTLKPCIYKKR